MEHHHFRALLRACKVRQRRTATRDYHLFLFLGRTGLRISEALVLTPKDLFLLHDPPFCAVRTLKRKAERVDEVFLDAPASRGLRRYLRRVLPAILGRGLYDTDHLFPGTSRAPGLHDSPAPAPAPAMSRRNALGLFRFYATRAGLPQGITLHSLRHYRGTQLYNKTGDLKFTQGQLRHAQLGSTQIYVHSTPERIRRNLDRLGGRKER